ncbi:hypothetical protein [Methylobacterium komagatae]|uniref:Uncharacterized protein n=1 Tax=Methylobacterium komagatae TaxID=374425 RepID=A0ABW2BK88_9HYPH
MSEATTQTAVVNGPSFAAALCGFVSSMVAASALVLLLVAL